MSVCVYWSRRFGRRVSFPRNENDNKMCLGIYDIIFAYCPGTIQSIYFISLQVQELNNMYNNTYVKQLPATYSLDYIHNKIQLKNRTYLKNIIIALVVTRIPRQKNHCIDIYNTIYNIVKIEIIESYCETNIATRHIINNNNRQLIQIPIQFYFFFSGA